MSTLALPAINARHERIGGWLRRVGLRQGMDVYEIGCGTGTVTKLILELLDGRGSLLAVDVNPELVEAAKERLRGYDGAVGVAVVAQDGVKFHPRRTFDAIVLPDVLEHIPAIEHGRLFERLAALLRPDGFVFIHIPNPPYLAWLRETQPWVLQQPCDEPVPTGALLAAAEPAGFRLYYLETYAIWEPDDYQAILLRKAS